MSQVPELYNGLLDSDTDISSTSEDSSENESVTEDFASDKGVSITLAKVAENYELMGTLSACTPPVIKLEDFRQQYPKAFTLQSENALSAVLMDLSLGFELSAFQVLKLPMSQQNLLSLLSFMTRKRNPICRCLQSTHCTPKMPATRIASR